MVTNLPWMQGLPCKSLMKPRSAFDAEDSPPLVDEPLRRADTVRMAPSLKTKVMLRTLPSALLASLALGVQAQPVGEVDTVFKLIGPDHKIVVDAYDDPAVRGITCYV